MLAKKMIVAAPDIKDRKFIKPLLCGPGPCDMWPSVYEELSKPVVSPLCDELFNVVDDIRAGIKYLFQTRSECVLAMSGSGHCGMEAVITNLVGPGETLLIASRGIWDERALNIASRYGINTAVTSVPMDETFSFAHLEKELKKIRPTALFIVHGDSSTGTVQKIEELGDLCHKYGTLLLVDTVVSVAAVPFFMDEWGVDGVYASTQKALSGPAGISPVAFSARAEYHHTLSPPLLWALRASLRELAKETLPKSWERHAKVTAYFHKHLQGQGFQFLVPKPEDRLATVTTITLPKGYDYQQFSKHMRNNHNILIFPGLGPTVGKSLRIGVMGINSTKEVADALVDAMMATLKALTKSSL